MKQEGYTIDTDKVIKLFQTPLTVINVGPDLFAKAVEKQGVKVLQVDFTPPAAEDKEMMDILAMLGGF